jgi:uncharacterized protein YecT (DUF1311 family)
MRPLVLALSVAAISLSTPVMAQDCAPTDDSQMCLNARAGAEYRAEDEKLNKAYGELIKRLSDSPDDKKLLQTAQRAWIAFRDAECEFATNNSKDGSIYPMALLGCKLGLTQARTEQLNAYLSCEQGDPACPALLWRSD